MEAIHTERANWSKAQKHQKACQVGRPDANSQQCTCCGRSIQKQPISLCQNTKELQFLGFGFPLFYIFTKYSMILLLLLIISYGSMSLFYSITQNQQFCIDNISKSIKGSQIEVKCTSWMVFLSRTEDDVANAEIVLRLTSFCIQLFALLYIRDKMRKTGQYYDEKTTSISDYSILIENIQKQPQLKTKITNLFHDEHIFHQKYSIEFVMCLVDLEKMYQLQENKAQHILTLDQLKRNSSESSEKIQSQGMEVQKLSLEIKEEKQRLSCLLQNDEAECEIAIIIFNKEQEKQHILQLFRQNANNQSALAIGVEKYLQTNIGQIIISEAPEPNQLKWENLQASKTLKMKRKTIAWTLFVLLLGCITVCFYFLFQFKGQQLENSLKAYHDNPKEYKSLKTIATAIVFIAILSVIFFNKFILSTIMLALTRIEKNQTAGQFQFSFALKYCLGLFFTTAVMTLLVEDIKFNNVYSHEFGVVQEESIMFFMNALLVPFIWLMNPWYVVKWLKRKIQQNNESLSQSEANELMEDPNYNMGKRYAEIVQSLWFTFLYISIIPMGSVLMFIGLILFYWIDKYNLLRKSTVTEDVSADLSLKMVKMIDFTLILRPAGELIFDNQVRSEWHVGSIICLVVGCLYLILPIDKILDFLHHEKFELEDKPYKEVKDSFKHTYMSLNPLYLNLKMGPRRRLSQQLSQKVDKSKSHETCSHQSKKDLSSEGLQIEFQTKADIKQ